MIVYEIAGVSIIGFKAMLNIAYLAFGRRCNHLDHDLIVDIVIEQSVYHISFHYFVVLCYSNH